MGALVFLQPWFLLGLAAVALPPIIHMIHRRRRQRVAFSTLRFLAASDRRSARKYRLVDMIVLALRMLMLLLLAAALAQPMLRPRGTASGVMGQPIVAVVIDDTLSMQRINEGARRFDRALEAARAVLGGLPMEAEAFVVLASGHTPPALAAPVSPPAGLIGPLADVECSASGRPLAEAINRAVEILQREKLPHKALIVIGDLQARSLMQNETLDGLVTNEDGSRRARVHSLHVIDVSGGDNDDLGIQAASVVPAIGFPGMPARVKGRVFNSGDAATSAAVALWVGDRKAAEEVISLAAGSPGEVVFTLPMDSTTAPHAGNAGIQRLSVRLANDALAGDNYFYLPYLILPPVRVLLITPPAAPGASGADEAIYLRTALAPQLGARGSRAAAMGGPVALTERTWPAAVGENLEQYGMIVACDGPAMPASLREALHAYTINGGRVVYFPASEWLRSGGSGGTYARFETGGARRLNTDGATTDTQTASNEMADAGLGLGDIERDHPALALLAEKAPGLMAEVTIAAALDLDEKNLGAQARVLARLEGGRPILVEERRGLGSCLAWMIAPHPDWSDLPLRPVFLPLVLEMVKHAAGAHAVAMATGTIDEGFALDFSPQPVARTVRIEPPDGGEIRMALVADKTRLEFTATHQPGFYTARMVEDGGGTDHEETPTTIAVNIDGEECVLERAPDDLIASYFPKPLEARIETDGRKVAERLGRAARGYAFSGWLLGAALAAMLIEIRLANLFLRGIKE